MKKYFFLVFLLIVAMIISHRSIYLTIKDPTGAYTAVVTYQSYLLFAMISPGSSSDKPGFVEIFNKNKISMGEIPIPMLQYSNIEWEKNGASIMLVGEWNFKKGICYYWSEDGKHKIYVKSP